LHIEETRAAAACIARGSTASGWGRILHRGPAPVKAELLIEEGDKAAGDVSTPSEQLTFDSPPEAAQSRGLRFLNQSAVYHPPCPSITSASILQRHFSAYDPGSPSPVVSPTRNVHSESETRAEQISSTAVAASALTDVALHLEPLPDPTLTYESLDAMSLPRLFALRSSLIAQREAATALLRRLTSTGEVLAALRDSKSDELSRSAAGSGCQNDMLLQ
jgi:hypothetical protein